MAKFKIKWESGEEEVIEQSDCATVAEYINCRFGRNAKAPAVSLADALVEELPVVKPVVTPPVKPVAKAKLK